MANILDAPYDLSTYMLKGWVLTDRTCSNKNCRFPLLRSPEYQKPIVHFCVNCDGGPDTHRQPYDPPQPGGETQGSPEASTSSTSHITRTSTPATEVSGSSDDMPPFVETEETHRRREQTDRASAEIGRRLLQGWTMLGDECPRESCYYVPLVRPPRTGGEQDPRKECVLCGCIYATERDWAGREHLVPAKAGNPSSNAPTAKSRPAQISVVPSPQDHTSRQITSSIPTSIIPTSAAQSIVPTSKSPTTASSVTDTLEESARALQLSLQVLTARLTSFASNPALADTTNIATTADAISKVTQALSHVKQLQWSELQAHEMR